MQLSTAPAHPSTGGTPVRLMVPASWPAHWPLTATLAAFPLWWVLGLSDLMPVFMAVPMALQLSRRDRIRTPAGFPVWLIFLLAVLASGFMLWLDAPGGVPGGGGERTLVFGYRLAWYLACTVVLLWVGNLDEEEVSSTRIVRLLGWMFVVTALGGLLGVLAPRFEFSSLAEIVLPTALSKNAFVQTLIHPAAASIQNVLGSDSPRPIAPFAYANSWGANLSMFLPFLVVGWLGRNAGWRRPVAAVVALIALVPVVFSLNRGLWLSLGLGGVAVVVHLALNGRPRLLFLIAGLAALGTVVFLASPLATMTSERLDNPHSNSRRGQLLSLTVESVAKGSPLVGFGSTRDVQGSFASIAGGGTPECPACEVPSLGTQGQIWLVVFSQGFLGLAAFVGFFGRQLARHWRARTALEFAGVICLLFFFLQLFVYDTLGMPMYTLMIAIALMWREESDDPLRHSGGSNLNRIVDTLRRNRRSLLSLALLGSLLGLWVSTTSPQRFEASVLVMLEAAPVHTDINSEKPPDSITVDTEAAMVFSEAAIGNVRTDLGLPESLDVRDMIDVSAPENTRVLRIAVTGEDPEQATDIAEALAASYIDVRSSYLRVRRDQVLADLNQQIDQDDHGDDLDPGDQPTEEELRVLIESLLAMPDVAGQALRGADVTRLGSHPELPVISGFVLGGTAALILIWIRRRMTDLKGRR